MQVSERVWFAFFGQPRRRSWPIEPTRFETLATRVGIEDEALRELLRRLIADRLRESARVEGQRVEPSHRCLRSIPVSPGPQPRTWPDRQHKEDDDVPQGVHGCHRRARAGGGRAGSPV